MTNLLIIILLLMLLMIEGHEEGSCPNICVCKWKGGKQTVECRNLLLDVIPDTIDSSTQVLDFTGNNLQILFKDTFIKAELLNLQKIFLRNCHLEEIDDYAFKGLSNLIELDLSQNFLNSIPSGTLKQIPSLRDLILSGNFIHRIENYAFKNIPNLVRLDLSECEIETILPKAFENLDFLQSLKINGNNLTELHERTIRTLSGLHAIELHDNPWYCDCQMRSTKLWLTENNIPLLISPRCSGGPKRIINRKFSQLHLDDFACKPIIVSSRQTFQSFSSENATLVCRANAIPAPTIKWFWNDRNLDNLSILNSQQKIIIVESGYFEKQSELILLNVKKIEPNEFFCLAENRAGSAETNFTLHITISSVDLINMFRNENQASIIILIILFLCTIIFITFLIIRLRRETTTESKTPKQIQVVELKLSPIENKKETNLINSINNENELSLKQLNNVNNVPYIKNNDCNKSTSTLTGYHNLASSSPTNSVDNNPDLINGTKQLFELTSTNVLLNDYDKTNVIYANDLMNSMCTLTTTSSSSMINNTTQTLDFNTIDKNSSKIYDFDTIQPQQFSTLNEEQKLIYNNSKNPIHPSTNEFNHSNHQLHQNSRTDYSDELGMFSYEFDENKSKISTLPNYIMPTNAKTLKVWQNGGVSVLPPITTIKRILTNNRNSPDEGYQEGCGTDV